LNPKIFLIPKKKSPSWVEWELNILELNFIQ